MKELSTELKQRIEEAGKDAEWTEKVHSVESLEQFEKLLAEKGIELPAEAKEAFNACTAKKTGKLEDCDLDKVTGGWTWPVIFNCPREYHRFFCELTFCPHVQTVNNVPNDEYYDRYCDLGYWRKNFPYPQ